MSVNPQRFDHVDPFTQTLDAIFALLANHDGVRKCIKSGNRLSTTRKNARGDASLLPADFPDLQVMPGDMAIAPFRTSTTATVQELFRIEVNSGTTEERTGLNPTRWQILRAFGGVDAPAPILGLPFITLIVLESVSAVLDKTDKGVDQWVPIFNVRVDYQFSRQHDLKAITPRLSGA